MSFNKSISLEFIFTSNGYRANISFNGEKKFTKIFKTKIGNFRVCFSSINHNSYPIATLLNIPENLKNNVFPHLEPNNNICYLDKDTTNLNPLDQGSFFATCILLVDNIVNDWASGKSASDIGDEFSCYWQGNTPLTLISEPAKILSSIETTTINNETINKYIVGKNTLDINNYISSLDYTKNDILYEVISVNIKHSFHVPFSIHWPINNLIDIFNWLELLDKDALNHLLIQLLELNYYNLVCVILKNSGKDTQEHIGFSFGLTNTSSLSLKNLAIIRKKKLSKSKRIKKKKNFSIPNTKDVLSLLNKESQFTFFERHKVKLCSNDYIINRNNSSSLKDKKIALIGAGTIGGYTSHALVQIGAGTGTGYLSIYDEDTFNSENIGRHYLSQRRYLDENKSEAIKHKLDEDFSSNIKAYPKNFQENDMLKPWDIVIDATGNQFFSFLLSSWFRKNQHFKKYILIHSWIAGYGLASRLMIDDGKQACYVCQYKNNNNKLEERYPLFKHGDEPNHNQQFNRKCGKTYMPFNSQPGLTSAGMIQSATLNIISNIIQTNFNQINFSDKVIPFKNKNLKAIIDCPSCSK